MKDPEGQRFRREEVQKFTREAWKASEYGPEYPNHL